MSEPLYSAGERPSHARARLVAAATLAACLAPLLTAAMLHADPAGFGTHQQMGLPACAWRTRHGYACPTCGMTTAFALAADGRLLRAAWTQPAGALAAMMTAMAAWAAGYTLATGARLGWVIAPLARPGALLAAGVLMILLAWGFKLTTG